MKWSKDSGLDFSMDRKLNYLTLDVDTDHVAT